MAFDIARATSAVLAGETKAAKMLEKIQARYYQPVTDMAAAMVIGNMQPQIKEQMRQIVPEFRTLERRFGDGNGTSR